MSDFALEMMDIRAPALVGEAQPEQTSSRILGPRQLAWCRENLRLQGVRVFAKYEKDLIRSRQPYRVEQSEAA